MIQLHTIFHCQNLCVVKCTGLEIIFFQGGNGIISNRRYDEFYTKWKPVKNGIYECNYSNYGLWNYCGVLNFMPKCTHTLRFSLFMYIFSQKIITDSQSPSKTESIDMSFVYVWRKKNFRKNPDDVLDASQTKNFKAFFELKYLDLYVTRRSFWRRSQIWCYFCWKI